MARWAPPATSGPRKRPRSKVRHNRRPCNWLLRIRPSPVPAPPVGKETESAPRTDAPRAEAPKPDAARPEGTAPRRLTSRRPISRNRSRPSQASLRRTSNGRARATEEPQRADAARAGRHHSTAQGGAGEGCGGQCAPRRTGPGAANATDDVILICTRETRRAERDEQRYGCTCTTARASGGTPTAEAATARPLDAPAIWRILTTIRIGRPAGRMIAHGGENAV